MRNDWDETFEQDNTPRIDALSKLTVSALHLGDRYIGTSAKMTDRGESGENDLQRDLFWSLYRNGEELKDPVPTSRVVNHKIIEWLTQGQTWPQTKAISQYRLGVSTSSAEIMTESLLNDPEVARLIEEQKKVEEKEEQAEQEEQDGEQMEGAGNPGGAVKAKANANQTKEQANAMAQALADKMDKFTDSAKGRAMQSAVNQQGKEQAKDTAETMDGWGIEDGPGSSMDGAELAKLLQQVKQSHIEELSRLIGRAHGVASHTLSTRKHLELVVTDAGYTKNPDDIFSDELALLSSQVPNTLRALQMAKLMDEGLLGVVKSVETKDEGDLIIAVDGSGSMQGEREYMAKALTLGICEAAHENGQGWKAFTFGSGNELTDTISQDTELATRLAWSTFLFGGGTDFDMALRHAIDEVEKSEDPTAVDIVMITDGDCGVAQQTIDRLSQLKQTFGVRLIAILVDAGYGSLDKVADATIVINGTDQIERAATQLSDNLWK